MRGVSHITVYNTIVYNSRHMRDASHVHVRRPRPPKPRAAYPRARAAHGLGSRQPTLLVISVLITLRISVLIALLIISVLITLRRR